MSLGTKQWANLPVINNKTKVRVAVAGAVASIALTLGTLLTSVDAPATGILVSADTAVVYISEPGNAVALSGIQIPIGGRLYLPINGVVGPLTFISTGTTGFMVFYD